MTARSNEPRAGDTVYCTDPNGPQGPGMLIAVTKAPVVGWEGGGFTIGEPAYLAEIAFGSGVVLVGKASLAKKKGKANG